MHFIKEKLKTLMGFLFRLSPLSTETGLRVIGNPDENSPVFVTGNFDLTVKRVIKHLRNLDCYLLAVPSRGINVWCAATGGLLSERSVISVIRTSGIDEKVKHRTLILPQLSASSIDIRKIRKETGWGCKFGPVHSKDIPEYVKNSFKKTDDMRRVKYDLIDRLDVGIGCSSYGFLFITALIFIFFRSWFYEATILYATLIFLFYVLFPYIPGNSGWAKIFSVEILVAVGLTVFLFIFKGDFAYSKFFWFSLVAIPIIGIDFGGISPVLMSDLDQFLAKLGVHKLRSLRFEGTQRGELFTGKEKLTYNIEKCFGCGMCYEVCPKGIFTIDKEKHKSIANFEKCVLCLSCVPQCPTGALIYEEVERTKK